MSDTIELTVDTREVEAAFQRLSRKITGSILRKALQSAGDVILETMVALAPERTDEPSPGGTSWPPGALKADLHTEIQLGGSKRFSRVKIGPSQRTAGPARWQEEGYMLTGHGKRGSRKTIRPIPGKHFMVAAFDESAGAAVDVFCEVLMQGLFDAENDENSLPESNYGGENY